MQEAKPTLNKAPWHHQNRQRCQTKVWSNWGWRMCWQSIQRYKSINIIQSLWSGCWMKNGKKKHEACMNPDSHPRCMCCGADTVTQEKAQDLCMTPMDVTTYAEPTYPNPATFGGKTTWGNPFSSLKISKDKQNLNIGNIWQTDTPFNWKLENNAHTVGVLENAFTSPATNTQMTGGNWKQLNENNCTVGSQRPWKSPNVNRSSCRSWYAAKCV